MDSLQLFFFLNNSTEHKFVVKPFKTFGLWKSTHHNTCGVVLESQFQYSFTLKISVVAEGAVSAGASFWTSSLKF